jgi:hypothetical protein
MITRLEWHEQEFDGHRFWVYGEAAALILDEPDEEGYVTTVWVGRPLLAHFPTLEGAKEACEQAVAEIFGDDPQQVGHDVLAGLIRRLSDEVRALRELKRDETED